MTLPQKGLVAEEGFDVCACRLGPERTIAEAAKKTGTPVRRKTKCRKPFTVTTLSDVFPATEIRFPRKISRPRSGDLAPIPSGAGLLKALGRTRGRQPPLHGKLHSNMGTASSSV